MPGSENSSDEDRRDACLDLCRAKSVICGADHVQVWDCSITVRDGITLQLTKTDPSQPTQADPLLCFGIVVESSDTWWITLVGMLT
jgi:hypothetical protein